MLVEVLAMVMVGLAVLVVGEDLSNQTRCHYARPRLPPPVAACEMVNM
jgi:hypothetical protein